MDRRTFLHMAIAVPAFNATAGELTQTSIETAHSAIDAATAGCPVEAVGRPAAKFPDAGDRTEGHVAGLRTPRPLEARARRRLFVGDRRRGGTLHDVRQAR